MSLPERCSGCDRPHWAGRQIITPPDLLENTAWHRRTYCRFCPRAQEEIRNGLAIAITDRADPTPFGGSNPFL